VQRSLSIGTNVLNAGASLALLLLRFLGSDAIHWVPLILMAVAGIAIGFVAGRGILQSQNDLIDANSEREVNATLREHSAQPMLLLGLFTIFGVGTIALIYRDAFAWTALTSFLGLLTAFFLARLVAIYKLNKRADRRIAEPAA